MTADPGAASFPDAAPARHTGRCGISGIPRFPDPRRVFRIRRCGPLEYGLRVLAELAAVPASLAITEWAFPLFRLRSFRPQPFTSWPGDWRAAFVAALCALAVLDIALLRLRVGGITISALARIRGFIGRRQCIRDVAGIPAVRLEFLRDHAAANGLDASREYYDTILASRAYRRLSRRAAGRTP